MIEDDDGKRFSIGGAICPACRFCADHGIPHLCIAQGDDEQQSLIAISKKLQPGVSEHGTPQDVWALYRELKGHPACPLVEGESLRVRAVDRTWCNCQCRRRPETDVEAGTMTNPREIIRITS